MDAHKAWSQQNQGLTTVGGRIGVAGVWVFACEMTLVDDGDASDRVVARTGGVVVMVVGSIWR